MEKDFWKNKTLVELTPEEWEALCDGCSKCCLFKLLEEDDSKARFTNVVCRYMDMETCRCTNYLHRHEIVPDCIYLTPRLAREANWLPSTCVYRLVAHGRDLPWWHPLKTGNPASALKTGNSVKNKVVSEEEVDPQDLEDMVVDWFD